MVIPIGTNVLVRGTSRDVIHSFWIPQLNGKRDMVPGRVQTLRMRGRRAGHLRRSVHRVLRALPRQHAHGGRRPRRRRLRDVEGQPAGAVRGARRRARWRPPARRRSSPSARAATRSTASMDADGDPVIAQPELYVYSEAAPNLTHLMTRNTFAGATFDLLIEACRDRVWDAPPEEFGAALPGGRHAGVPQRGRPARVAAQRAGEEADVRRRRRSSGRRTARLAACRTWPCPRTRSTSSSPTSWNGTDPWPSSNAPSRPRPPPPPGAGRRAGHPVDLARRLPPPGLGHRLAVLAVHGRPQEARHHVRRQRHGVLRRRRHRGAAHPGPAGRPPTARCCRRTSTTRCSPCTPRPWCSSSPCRWRPRSATTSCRCRSAPVTSPSPASTPSASGRFLFGALFVNTSWILGGAADGGWFMYAPNSSVAVLADPRHRHLGARPA